jgi:hypothetical protein
VHKQFLDAFARFGASLVKLNVQGSCEGLAFFMGDLSVDHIDLVAHKHLGYIFRSMHFDLFDPILNILKSFTLIDCIGKYYPHGSSIVCLCDSLKLLLASSVPNLKSNFVFADHDSFDFEVDSYGCEMGCHEVVITKFKQHVRLTHTAVAYYQQLYVVVVILTLLHLNIIKTIRSVRFGEENRPPFNEGLAT